MTIIVELPAYSGKSAACTDGEQTVSFSCLVLGTKFIELSLNDDNDSLAGWLLMKLRIFFKSFSLPTKRYLHGISMPPSGRSLEYWRRRETSLVGGG